MLPDYPQHLEVFEGRIPWMYLDGPGNVTIGVGHLIASAKDALEMPFPDGGDPLRDWSAVKAATPGRGTKAYEPLTKCRLSDASIDLILRADLFEAEHRLRPRFPAFEEWPQEAQTAVLDMAFNLGTARLMRDFPRFIAAAASCDWATAAAQCHRCGIQDARNEYVKGLLQGITHQ